MALAETPATLLHRAEWSIENKAINEGIDLLNIIGESVYCQSTQPALFLMNAHSLILISAYPCTTVSLPVLEGELKEESVKVKELAILKLGATLAKNGFVEGLYKYCVLVGHAYQPHPLST